MLAFLALALPAHALDVQLAVAPARGAAAWVTFRGVTPGDVATAEVPCGTAPSCRLAVTVTPDVEGWRVAVEADEVRHRLFGRERLVPISHPTFVARADEWASLFVGGEHPLSGSALAEVGLHVQAFVHDGDAVGAR